jgi:PAS domain-containing protein
MDDSPLVVAQKFAAMLTIPVFVVDRDGTLLFHNKAAGEVLGRSFDETGSMPASTWSRLFLPTDEQGTPLLPEDLPLMMTINENRAAHGTLWIEGIDNVRREISVASFPVTNQAGKLIGAVAVFWELKETEGGSR